MTNALAAKADIAQSTHSRLEATHDRIETMLEQQQAALQKDHARIGLVLGATMVVTGMVLMIAGIPFAFSLTGMVWGAIVASLSLILRHRGRRRLIEHTRLMCELHERSTRLAQRTELLERVWEEGLPANCSVGDVLVLLDAQMPGAGYDPAI